jgi:hypothetical protein
MLSASFSISGGMVALKKSVWRFGGSFCSTRLHIVDEAHVQHAVGLVEHEDLQPVQVHEALLHQIKQATGSGHHDVHTAVQGIGLWLLAHATEDHGVRSWQVATISRETLADLDGQLAGGREDERTNGAAFGAAVPGNSAPEGWGWRRRRSCRCRSVRNRAGRGPSPGAEWLCAWMGVGWV